MYNLFQLNPVTKQTITSSLCQFNQKKKHQTFPKYYSFHLYIIYFLITKQSYTLKQKKQKKNNHEHKTNTTIN